MGGGSGKGGGNSAYVAYDYYGTIAALLRCGPVDTIRTLMVNGEIIWQGPINRTDGGVGNPYTLTLSDPKWLAPGGYVRLYWGDDSQTAADGALTGHPPYRGMAYMVFKNFLFGRETTSAPNIEVIADYLPRPPGAVIAATGWDGNSVNPWAVLAELLCSIHGVNLPAARLDAASWQAAHDYFAGSATSKLLAYCAPLLDQQGQLQQLCNDLLSLCDGGLRQKNDGTIEAFYYPVDPGDLSAYPVLTANELTSPADVTYESWDAVPTGVMVNFTDGDEWFVAWSVKADDLRALQQAVEPRRETLQVPFVIRRSQAARLGAEWCKRKCQPQISGTIDVRPEKAVNLDGTPLRVGNRFMLDIEPEPGGDGLMQLCRVTKRTYKATGPVTIEFAGEVNQPAVPFTPDWTPPGNEEVTVAAIPTAQIVPLPSGLAAEPSIGVLASRGDDLTVGAHVLFDVAGGAGTFTTLGSQLGFAVPCLFDAIDASVDTPPPMNIKLLDTRDEALALVQPGDSGAQDDELLICVFNLTVDGYILENADGTPQIEWFSIIDSALLAGGMFGPVYTMDLLRSRLGSSPQTFLVGAVGFIIPRVSIEAFIHGNFAGYVTGHDDLVFRLSPYSRIAEFSGVPANLPFHFPTSWERAPQIAWTTPATATSTLPGTGNLTPAASITDNDLNLIQVELYSVREDTEIQTVHFNVRVPPTGSISLADCFTRANLATPLNFAGQVAVDTYYTLTIRAIDASRNVTESRRTLVRLATGGGSPSLVPPTITPDSDTFTNSLVFTMDVAAPANRIEYVLTTYGGANPGGGYTTYVGTHTGVNISSSKRVWCRSGDGTNWSSWVFADFLKQSGGGGQPP